MTQTRPPALIPAEVEPDPWLELRLHGPARIALGRAGTSLPTRASLELGLAHARARDAVHAPLDTTALTDALAALGMPCLQVHSAAGGRDEYLLRPDLGRRLAEASTDHLRACAADGLACDLLIVVADGLSATAIQRNAVPVCAEILRQAPPGARPGPVVVAHQARVALGDACGHLLGARMVAVLIGERPGLSTPDSLGIYLTYAPRPGLSDADRNCISNIHRDGLGPVEAARKLWWLAHAATRLGRSGVGLKDGSGGAALPTPGSSEPPELPAAAQ